MEIRGLQFQNVKSGEPSAATVKDGMMRIFMAAKNRTEDIGISRTKYRFSGMEQQDSFDSWESNLKYEKGRSAYRSL